MFDLALLPSTTTGRRLLGSNFGVKIHSVTDGTSNTIMLSELLGVNSSWDGRALGPGRRWAPAPFRAVSAQHPRRRHRSLLRQLGLSGEQPDDVQPAPAYADHSEPNPPDVAAARSNHSGGIVIVGMVDGSVHMVSGDTLDLTVWQALATRAGGENVALP